jgi:D-alanine-D-alanine ligase
MYPLFVKGMASENSIGIDEHSLVHGQRELSAKVEQIVSELHQPALVEEYIAGRELGAAILPGQPSRVLPISEIIFGDLPEDSRFLDYQAMANGEPAFSAIHGRLPGLH